MNIKTLSKGQEVVLGTCRAYAALAKNVAIQFVTTTFGVDATVAINSTTTSLIRGITVAAIGLKEYGEYQCSGPIQLSIVVGATPIAVGEALAPTTDGTLIRKGAGAIGEQFTALEGGLANGTRTIWVWVNCM